MNDHNLDDLIIDNISPKNTKTKSFLTIIALAIVMLIIAIILTKIILKDPKSQSSEIDENSIYLSPDLTLQSSDTQEDIVKAPHIPTTETVKPEITMPSHTVDNARIEAKKKKELELEAKEAQKQIELKKAQEAQKQIELNKTKEKIAKEQAIAEAQAMEKAKAEAKAKAEKERQEAKKLSEQQVKQAPKQAQVMHPYFIQVGSFSKTPSSRFLTVITKSGFHYQITTSVNNGNKKLLIGPYNTKADADKALVRVKDRINKSAYIIRK